jgi:hypothetical protein
MSTAGALEEQKAGDRKKLIEPIRSQTKDID